MCAVCGARDDISRQHAVRRTSLMQQIADNEYYTIQLALGRYSKTSGMEKQAFGTIEEAEAWLDKKGS